MKRSAMVIRRVAALLNGLCVLVLLGRVMLAGGRSYTLGNAGATAVRAAGVTSGQLLGRVRLRVGCLGAVLAWARTPRGLAALLLAGVLLAELPSFLQPVKKPRRKQPGGYPAAGRADGASQ